MKVKILIKTLQTDKKKRNVLTFSREAVANLVATFDNFEETIGTSANMLNDNESFYMEAGYLLHTVLKIIERKLEDIEGSQLSGTEGIWDVS